MKNKKQIIYILLVILTLFIPWFYDFAGISSGYNYYSWNTQLSILMYLSYVFIVLGIYKNKSNYFKWSGILMMISTTLSFILFPYFNHFNSIIHLKISLSFLSPGLIYTFLLGLFSVVFSKLLIRTK